MARSKTTMFHLRLITFFTADLFLLSCALTALFLPYIPIKHDILGLAAHYPVYLQIATVLSCIALYGVFKQSSFITHLFSSFLIVDLFVSALPRALLITSIFRAPTEILSQQNLPPTLITSAIADPSGIPLVDALVTDGVVGVSAWWGEITAGMGETSYNILSTFLKLAFIVVLGMLSTAQAAAANCVRKYALRLKRGESDNTTLNGGEYYDEYEDTDGEVEPKSILEDIVVDLGSQFR